MSLALSGFFNTEGHKLTNTYNINGNLTSMTDSLGRTSNFEYDSYGRLNRKIDTFGYEVNYTYDANGNRFET